MVAFNFSFSFLTLSNSAELAPLDASFAISSRIPLNVDKNSTSRSRMAACVASYLEPFSKALMRCSKDSTDYYGSKS